MKRTIEHLSNSWLNWLYWNSDIGHCLLIKWTWKRETKHLKLRRVKYEKYLHSVCPINTVLFPFYKSRNNNRQNLLEKNQCFCLSLIEKLSRQSPGWNFDSIFHWQRELKIYDNISMQKTKYKTCSVAQQTFWRLPVS